MLVIISAPHIRKAIIQIPERLTMMSENPLFYQFHVKPTAQNSQFESLAGAIATVMVFAETEEIGRARSSRHIAIQNWEIVEIKRVLRMCPKQIAHLQTHFRTLYLKAEQFGIAAQFDGWPRHCRHL
jgi:hypothetical protein